jgi:hypothetical protein
VPILIGAIALVAAGLISWITVAIVRGNRTRRRVLAARANAPTGTPKRHTGDDR